MSLPEQILAALRNASGPMNSGEIRDAVGLEGAAGQTKVASALKNLLDRGALSREFEGGSYRYLAVPGWQPERRAGGRPKHDKAERTGSNPPPPKAAKPAPPPSPPSTAATLSVVVDASAATKAMDAALAELGDQVLLPRRTVRTLLAGILMFGDDLGDQLRDAVIDATQRAA